MSDDETYEIWLENLRDMAAIESINLHLDKYHYHTYFMRGWSIESMIVELSEND